jgi:hypothetical protein
MCVVSTASTIYCLDIRLPGIQLLGNCTVTQQVSALAVHAFSDVSLLFAGQWMTNSIILYTLVRRDDSVDFVEQETKVILKNVKLSNIFVGITSRLTDQKYSVGQVG